MRTLLIAIAACGVLAASAAAMSAPATRTCAAVATPTGLSSKIKATRVGCPTARRVAHAFAVHGKAKGWKCTAKPYQGGASATCRRTVAGNQQVVRFSIAD